MGSSYVYLIHLDEPIRSKSGRFVKSGQHYVGATSDLQARLRDHSYGAGSRFLRAVKAEGIGWQLVRSWRFTARFRAFDYERALKRRKRIEGFCPICRAAQGKEVLSLKGYGPGDRGHQIPAGNGHRGRIYRKRRKAPTPNRIL